MKPTGSAATYALQVKICVIVEIYAPFQHRPDSDGHDANIHDDARRCIRNQVEVVMPLKVTAVIVLKEFC